MTSNDAQIDVLLRRYARKSPTNATTEHLDADELNAFAEGSLPAAARARYVSHLLDCDNCRQIVSQLTISSGAIVGAESSSRNWIVRLFLVEKTFRILLADDLAVRCVCDGADHHCRRCVPGDAAQSRFNAQFNDGRAQRASATAAADRCQTPSRCNSASAKSVADRCD